MSTINWLPLESNPTIINRYINRLGVAKKWGVSDVLSLDEDYAATIPTPCLAILLLFPITPEYIEFVITSERHEDQRPELNNVYFMRQTINESCGTIALIHAIANSKPRLRLRSNSALKLFLDSTRNLSPEERGQKLELDVDITDMHDETAQEGEADGNSDGDDRSQDDRDCDVLHFIALVKVGDKLVELDGIKSGPVVHGNTTDETFVRDAFRICQSFIDREPASWKFNVMNFGTI